MLLSRMAFTGNGGVTRVTSKDHNLHGVFKASFAKSEFWGPFGLLIIVVEFGDMSMRENSAEIMFSHTVNKRYLRNLVYFSGWWNGTEPT